MSTPQKREENMSIYRGITMHQLFAVVGCLGLLFFFSCCDDEPSNVECEQSCVEKYAGAVDSCEENAATCMEDCSSPDDTSCMWDCEDYEFECNMAMFMCMSGCPCLEASQHCVLGCDTEDMDCLTACSDDYVDCAGVDSAYNCVSLCSSAKTGCVWACEDISTDMSGYLDCRAECHQTFKGCLDDCV